MKNDISTSYHEFVSMRQIVNAKNLIKCDEHVFQYMNVEPKTLNSKFYAYVSYLP